MPQIAITILRPCDVVWRYLLVITNWEKWWSAALIDVTPGWVEGASLNWQDGQRAELHHLVDGHVFELCSPDLTTRIQVSGGGAGRALVTIDYYPRYSAFRDGGAELRTRLTGTLLRLRDAVEAEFPR